MTATSEAGFSTAEIAAGEALFKAPCVFVKGVVAIDGLPDDGRPEIAFAGRSMSASRALSTH